MSFSKGFWSSEDHSPTRVVQEAEKMANIKEYLEGDYLRVDEVTKGDMAVIIEPPVLVDKVYKGKPQKKLEGKVEFKQKVKVLSWNKTNAKNCSKSWGEETQSWLGKVVLLDNANQLIAGNMTKVLVVMPRDAPQTAVEEKLVQPEWMTEEMIKEKIEFCQGMISRDAAVKILLKEKEAKV